MTIKIIQAKVPAPFYLKLRKDEVTKEIEKILPNYDILTKDKKDFLLNLYLKSYKYGTQIVKSDSFRDDKNIICQDLKDRFDNYSDIGTQDIAFIKKVAENDETALNAILEQTSTQEDFAYQTYESNYIDRSTDILRSITIPKGFEEIDVTLLSQDAFADGAMKKIDYLSKKTLSQWAVQLIGEI